MNEINTAQTLREDLFEKSTQADESRTHQDLIREVDSSSLSILYLGNFDVSSTTETYVTKSLEALGHTVHRLSYKLATLDRVTPKLEGVDVLLLAKRSVPCLKDVIPLAKEKGITVVTWVWDLFYGFGRKPPQHCFDSDLFLSSDGGHIEELGPTHKVLRQGIYGPEALMRYEGEEYVVTLPYDPNLKPYTNYKHDVAFVGSLYNSDRRALVSWLQSTYGDRFIHHTKRRGLNLNTSLSEVKVVVGDSFPSANYWSNRIYEITGRGGFLLHPHTKGLDSEYTEGEHYIGYSRLKGNKNERRTLQRQLKTLIDQWVDDNEKREAVRIQGFLHTSQNYTYEIRCRELVDTIHQHHKSS